MPRPHLLPWLALLLAGTGCGSSLPRPELERFDLKATPNPADYPVVPAVVLLDRGELLLTYDPVRRSPMGRLRRYQRLQILRESGLDRAAITVPFDPGSAVHGLVARATWPDGRAVEVDGERASEILGADGRKAKRLALPEVVPGTVIDFAYDLYVEDLRFLPPWAFQTDVPTVRSELAVIVPRGFEVDLRYSTQGAFIDRPPERFDVEGGTRFSWSEANLPALFPEEGMPAPQLISPRAHVLFVSAQVGGHSYTGFGSWDDVATWFQRRMPNWSQLRPETVAEAKRVAGDASLEEQALKLLEVIARDLPEEVGPTPPYWRARLVQPETVLQEKRANPTSRGLLLVALLRAAGLPAVPALYARRDRDLLPPDAPAIYGVEGIVAVVPRPGGPLILNPSELTVAGGVAPPSLQGTRIVALHDDGAEVMLVPASAPAASRTEITYALDLDRRGDLHGKLEARLTGAEAGLLRAKLLRAEPEDYATLVNDFLASRGGGLPAESVQIADLDALRRPLTLTGAVEVKGALRGEGEQVALSLGRLVGVARAARREVRRFTRVFEAPHQVEVRATLMLPEDWTHASVPPPSSEAWSGGLVELSARAETKRRLGISRRAESRLLEAPAKRWSELTRFVDGVSRAEDELILLSRPRSRELEY